MKKVCGILIIMVMILLVGCSGSKEKVEEDPVMKEYKKMLEDSKDSVLPVMTWEESEKIFNKTLEFKEHYGKGYKLSVWDKKKTGIAAPGGIICQKDRMIVSDIKNNCLIVLDYDGNKTAQIGKMGNGPLEFQQPTGMAVYNNQLYVIDSKNRRIQILDKNFQYVSELKLDRGDERDAVSEFYYRSIAIDKKGTVYASANFLYKTGILKLEQGKKEAGRINERFYGSLYEYKGDVYAVNQGQVFVKPVKEHEEIGVRGAHNYLFKIEGDKLVKKAELNSGMFAGSFIYDGKNILLASFSRGSMMKFDALGRYIETGVDIKGLTSDSYMDLINNTVYITDQDTGTIYKIHMRK